ncbi:MAG: hypothetical protein O7B99_08115 [Planctomycetota bacterium]|nr:hypothetical protein [Planctomycetota bacterium]
MRRKPNLFPLIVAAICFLAAYGLGSAEARASDTAAPDPSHAASDPSHPASDAGAQPGAPCSEPLAP